jgi:hypothetical protein
LWHFFLYHYYKQFFEMENTVDFAVGKFKSDFCIKIHRNG